jgi:4-amino-4-deoxy-L-arabinose transferase-like glycosyltransferase
MLLLFVVALGYRGLCFAVAGDHVLLRYPVVDAQYHDAQARRMTAGDWIGHGPDDVFKPPLYPAYVALHYLLFGRHIPLVQWSQFLLGASSCVLLALLGTRLFGRATGRIAGFLAALYPPFVFFELQLLTPALTVFLNSAALLVLVPLAPQRYGRLIGAGLLLGLSAGVRSDVLLPAGLILLYLLYSDSDLSWRQRLAPAGAVCAGGLLVLVPLVVRNAYLTGEFIPISSNAGINLYTGNSARADGVSAVPVGLQWERLVCRVPQPILEKPARASRWWVHATWAEMHAEPGAALRRLATKALAFFNRREFRNNIDYHFFARDCRPLRIWPLQLSVILPLGACGFWWLARSGRRDHRQGAALCGLGVVGYWAAGILFFVTARFRLPSVPLLMLPAAFAVVHTVELVRTRQRRDLAAGAIAAAVMAVACWPLWLGEPRQGWAQDYLNLSRSYTDASDDPAALRAAEHALSLAPQDPEAHFLWAGRLMPARPREALEHLQVAREYLPDAPSLLLALGRAHLQLGDPQAAGEVFHQLLGLEKKLNLWPKRSAWALAYIHLADLEPGQRDEHWERAWTIDPPSTAEAAFLLDREPNRVLEVFRSEARRKPWDWYSHANLGMALLRQGQAREAVTPLHRASRLAPDKEGVSFQLALAFAQAGDNARALPILDRLARQLPLGGLRAQVEELRRQLHSAQ